MPVNWAKPVTVSVAMTNLRVMPDQTMSKKKKKKKIGHKEKQLLTLTNNSKVRNCNKSY